MTPSKMHEVMGRIKSLNKEVHVHCHNDFGLAVANSLAGFEAGAKCIDVTVNGLGERNGIAPLAEICAALHALYGVRKWKLEGLKALSESVEKMTGVSESQRAPVVSSRAFSHVAGLHTSAVLRNPETYQHLDPKIVGGKLRLHMNQFTNSDTISKVFGSDKEIAKYKKREKESVWNFEN
jgi:isopropylmalate/homocitrate/citramalate synthase